MHMKMPYVTEDHVGAFVAQSKHDWMENKSDEILKSNSEHYAETKSYLIGW